MISVLVLLILINWVVFPILWLGEALFCVATNQAVAGRNLLAYRWQDLKYKWMFGKQYEYIETFETYLGFDLVIGCITMFAFAFLGYWMVLLMAILGGVLGCRWYFQNKEK